MRKISEWPPNQAERKDYFVEKLKDENVFYLVEFNDATYCLGCSLEQAPSGQYSWKKKPIEVETIYRTIGSTPDVPLYFCHECGKKQWKPA